MSTKRLAVTVVCWDHYVNFSQLESFSSSVRVLKLLGSLSCSILKKRTLKTQSFTNEDRFLCNITAVRFELNLMFLMIWGCTFLNSYSSPNSIGLEITFASRAMSNEQPFSIALPFLDGCYYLLCGSDIFQLHPI